LRFPSLPHRLPPVALICAPLGFRPTFLAPALMMKRSVAQPVLERPRGELLAPLNGQKGASWVVLGRGAPRIAGRPAGLKKQLRMGAARWLCSGHRPERSAWLDNSARVLLTSARRPDVPHPTREAGPSWSRRASRGASHPPLAGSDDAEARRTASGRCGGSAQSRGWCGSFDRWRSDLCWRHHQGSCGPFSARPVREQVTEKF
jgi:hypothetical protein